jgi:hypothetical protein
VQAADGLLRQNDAKGIADFADLQFKHLVPHNVITIVATSERRRK